MLRSISALSVAALLLAACGHSDGIVPSAPAGGSGTPSAFKGGAKLSVIVPRPRSSRGRHADYISPSSAKLLVAFNKSNATTYGLTPQSPGCTLMQNNVTCTFEVIAPPGNDALSLTIEDTKGRVLSRNVVSVKLRAGVQTPVSVTLDAVPARVIAVPGAGSAIEGTADPAYHAPGLITEPIELEALDADGNVIVGPGAPVIGKPTISRDSAYASVVSAHTNDPNAYLLEPVNGSAGGRTVTVSATAQSLPLGNGQTGRPVAGATRFLFTPALALANGETLSEYSVETGALITQFNVCGGGCSLTIANALTSDADGNVWLAYTSFLGLSVGHVVEEFPPNAKTYTTVLSSSSGVTGSVAIATGPNDMLYVLNAASGFLTHRTPPSITEYAKGATSPTNTIDDSTVNSPLSIAVNSSGDVYVGGGDGTITVYGTGAPSQPKQTLTDPNVLVPGSMVFGKNGGLYVYDDDTTNNNYYIAYFSLSPSSAAQILSCPPSAACPDFNGDAAALALDGQGDLIASTNNSSPSATPTTWTFAASALPNALQPESTLDASGYPAWIP